MQERVTLFTMIRRETQRSTVNTLLCLVTVMVATGLLVAMVSVTRASVDATRVMMKNLGFNVLITPAGVDPARYQALDFQDVDMPEEYVERLASSTVLAQHFVGKYQRTVQVEGRTLVLTGVLPEVPKHSAWKRPMQTAHVVPEGKVFLGSAAAASLGLAPGAELAILGRSFTVDRVLDEVGMIPDDIRVFAHLHDVQELLGVPGRINAMDALACYCPVNTADLLGTLVASIERVLPDVNVEPYQSILVARQKQRETVYQLELAAVAIVVAGAATAIWGLTYQNVRNRRREIGVLRALGVGSGQIAVLFLGKIFGYAVLGTILGCAIGCAVGHGLNTTGRPTSVPVDVFAALFLAAPVAAILFGLPPIVSGLLLQPTDVLREGAA